jgi:hypothetical protein
MPQLKREPFNEQGYFIDGGTHYGRDYTRRQLRENGGKLRPDDQLERAINDLVNQYCETAVIATGVDEINWYMLDTAGAILCPTLAELDYDFDRLRAYMVETVGYRLVRGHYR